MVDSVNRLSGVSVPVGAGKALASDGSKGEASKPAAGTASNEPVVQISGSATTLSSLYEAANAFVQKSSVKPLTGSSSDGAMSYYLNIENTIITYSTKRRLLWLGQRERSALH